MVEETIAAQEHFAVLPSMLINQLVMIPASGKKIPLSYEGNPYLRQQIDAFPSHPKQMFMYGRQTYKCLEENQRVRMADGGFKPIKDVYVGDEVLSFDESTNQLVTGVVSWKSPRYKKRCICVRTWRGEQVIFGETHPLREERSWTPVKDLHIGSNVAHVVGDKVDWGFIRVMDDVGEQWCYDLAVDGTSSFIVDGLVTHNSTSISAQIHAYINTLGITWQYVSATMEQAREFSQWKLDGAIRDSDILSGFFDQSGNRRPYNVKRKESFAGGRVLIGTAYGDAARIRGNPADALSIDEIALVDLDAIGVLRECLSASTYGWELHAGTPLSTDNPQWIIWSERSKQHEWAVPCDRHSPRVWNILGVKNLTPYGIICERCGEPIDTRNGRWIITAEPNLYTYDSYRLPQIASPTAKFDEIVRRLIDEPVITMRESFAYSVEQASEVFSDHFLTQISEDNLRISPENFVRLSTTRPMVAGIDWAQPDPKDPQAAGAATTLTLGCYTGPEKFTWIAAFRFRGDPDRDLDEICRIIDSVHAHRIVADHGAGYSRNIRMMQRYKFPRFMACKYNRQDEPININPKSFRLSVDRNTCLDALATNIRMHPNKYSVPCRRDMERAHWWQDLRAVLVEYDSLGRTLFVKRSGKTDDHWHSMFYCFLAAHTIHPRLDVLAPIVTKTMDDD